MKSVLIIEDDLVLRELTSTILLANDFVVDSAENGKDGLKLINKNNYDVILCDIMMPGMNGFEVLKRLRSANLSSHPVFIYITAKSERIDLRKGMELGADDFITKPYTSKELLNSINIQLKKKKENINKFDIENTIVKILNEKFKSDPSIKLNPKNNESQGIKYEGNLFLADGKKSEFVKMKTVVYIESAKDYTKIFTSDAKSFLIRKPIKQWEEKLPKEHFLRIHRSTIINTDYIKKVERWNNYTHKIYLIGITEPFIISQRYSRILKKQIKGI
jgi:DNA-binding LytR/AlgR family response regulator